MSTISQRLTSTTFARGITHATLAVIALASPVLTLADRVLVLTSLVLDSLVLDSLPLSVLVLTFEHGRHVELYLARVMCLVCASFW
jgi:hypothetical protein